MPYALVTGASKGIGKAIALELAKYSYDILLTARSADLLKAAADEIKEKYPVKVAFLALDLSLSKSPQNLHNWCIEHNYDVEVLVNNAGFGLSGPFDSVKPEENASMLQLNVIVPTLLCQLFVPLLKNKKQAYILNIISSAAYQAVPLLSIYSASKAYLLNFTRALHHELKKTNISVTAVSPGPTDTDWIHTARVTGKALKVAGKVHMQPSEVARIAVKAMFRKKIEVIVGMMNQAGAFFAWLLPKKFVERTASKMYE